jgi:hypothetical protein
MKRGILALALVAFLNYEGARGADEPKALLERALRGSGDWSGLPHAPGTYVRNRVSLGGRPETMTLEMQMQPDKRLRIKLTESRAGERDTYVVILNGKKGWQKENSGSEVRDLPEEEVAEIDSIAFHERVADLHALLQDKRFVFTALGESKVEGKVVKGVKVACKGEEDTFLYFDKTTGLLTRVRYQKKFADRKQVGKYEITFLDYSRCPGESGEAGGQAGGGGYCRAREGEPGFAPDGAGRRAGLAKSRALHGPRDTAPRPRCP